MVIKLRTLNRFNLIFLFILLILFIGINVVLDSYGVFFTHHHLEKFKPINNVMVDKAMFSHKLIPENFDGLLIGPAFSININTLPMQNDIGVRVYNLSIGSTNIVRIKDLVLRIADKGRLKTVIFSLDPYFTTERSDAFYMPNRTFPAYGSVSLLKRYYYELRELLSGTPVLLSNFSGYVEYHKDLPEELRAQNVKDSLAVLSKAKDSLQFIVSQTIIDDFKLLLDHLRSKQVKIVAYFHPRHRAFQKYYAADLDAYKTQMRELFSDDKVIDFTEERFSSFSADEKNYTDLAHFSSLGADKFYKELLVPNLIH